MKKCSWCGKEYPDHVERCLVDQQPLTGSRLATAPAKENAQQGVEQPLGDLERAPVAARASRPVEAGSSWGPQLIDLAQVDGAFEFKEGYSRPNWKIISEAIKQTVPEQSASAAFTEAAIQWAERVAAESGPDYLVRCSEEFILMSALEAGAAKRLLSFAEATGKNVYALLRDAAWRDAWGKYVLFLFAETGDYYRYVSYFHTEGIHPASGGCLINRGYVHIAMPYLDGRHIRSVLAHELVHNSVAHLPLPLWPERIAMMPGKTPRSKPWGLTLDR